MNKFLRQSARGEDSSSEGADLEEQYERLFPKIGRDFVHREDLQKFFDQIMTFIDPFGISGIELLSDSEARGRAREYKSFLDAGKDGSKVYKDLINLDD